jgi:hypothetical protein
MRPFDPGRMRSWPVGSRVGAVANQGEDQPTVAPKMQTVT